MKKYFIEFRILKVSVKNSFNILWNLRMYVTISSKILSLIDILCIIKEKAHFWINYIKVFFQIIIYKELTLYFYYNLY